MRQTSNILLAVAMLLVCSCAPHIGDIQLDEDTICVDIGLEEDLSFCSENGYNPQVNYWFNSYYLIKDGQRIAVPGMGADFEVYEMLVSPSRRYMAVVENGGEGHPYLSIMSLDEVRRGDKPRYTTGYDPYPGTITDMRWEKDRLVFKSDVELPSDNTKPDETATYHITCSLDVETGKLEQLGKPTPLDNGTNYE